MISLPLSSEIESKVQQLSLEEKKVLAMMIQAFVSKPSRSISVVMDEMASYAKKQGILSVGIKSPLID